KGQKRSSRDQETRAALGSGAEDETGIIVRRSGNSRRRKILPSSVQGAQHPGPHFLRRPRSSQVQPERQQGEHYAGRQRQHHQPSRTGAPREKIIQPQPREQSQK